MRPASVWLLRLLPALLLPVSLGRPAPAAEPRPADSAVAVGFDGGYRTNAWTPVTVAGNGIAPGDVLHVWAEDPDGQFVRSPPGVAAAGADGRPAARFTVRFGRPTGRIRIERAGAAGAAIVERRLPEPLPSTARIVLCAGDLPAIDEAARIIAREGEPVPRVLPLTAGRTAAGAAARDYDAVEAIVVCGRAVADLPADVMQGIDAWVRCGGRLVLVAGGSAEGLPPTAAGWLPAACNRTVTLRRLGGLETHARAGRLPPRAAAGVRVPVFSAAGPLPGVVDVTEGSGGSGTPLVVRRCHGLGTIAWLGVDIDEEPFRDWPGSGTLLANLLGGRPEPLDGEGAAAGSGRDTDLAMQLRTAIERFVATAASPAVTPVPFEVVAAIGLLYVLCLYPLDWWFVSRAGGRPWVAWSSLAVLVTAFTAVAWGVHAARQPRSAPGGRTWNVTEVVDIDAVGGGVRGSGWAAVYSAVNDRLDVGLEVEPAAERAVSWWGDAGRGFAAVDAAMPHPALAAADYAYAGSLAALAGVPIAAASSRVFEAEWHAQRSQAAVTADLVAAAQGTLRGTLAHHLPMTLEDCRLVHGGWLYDVGRLEPGQRYDTAGGRGPRSLAAALTRRSAVKERDVAARWNPAAADAERILEVAGFHAAAGGAAYTLGGGGRLARLDLTPLVRLDRAVLVGVAARGQAAWSFTGGQAPARGLYRIVIPVAPAAATER
jgi:hypothetical protein